MANCIADLFRDVEEFQCEVVGWTGIQRTAADRKLCVKLIAEELAEYDEACERGNPTDILNEAVDLVYVCVGALIRTCHRETLLQLAKFAQETMTATDTDAFMLSGETISTILAANPRIYGPVCATNEFVNYHDNFYTAWDRIHAANMRKKDGPIVDGKRCKPDGWVPADLSDLVLGG